MRISMPLSVFVGSVLLTACDSKPLTTDLHCASIYEVSPGDDVAASLTEAASGDCVWLDAGDHSIDALTVPVGVTLFANGDATLQSTDDSATVVTLSDAASLHSLSIAGGGRGVEALGNNLVQDISITGSDAIGISIDCGDCGPVTLDGVDQMGAENGLALSGTEVIVFNSTFSNNGTLTAVGGWGIVASNGAELTLDKVDVSANDYAILADGADTRVYATDIVATDNAERGVWVQNLTGTLDEPAVTIEGENTRIEGNGGVGFGAWHTLGIIITNGWFRNTSTIPIQTDIAESFEMADGLAFYEGTGQATITDAVFAHNERSQVLLDSPGAGLTFNGCTYDISEGGVYELVVQGANSATEPDYGGGETPDSTPEPLETPDQPLAVP
jgi:hypothetical protein